MNLARFGLLKTSEGKMAPDGYIEEVEITEEEAHTLPPDAYTVESREPTPLEQFAARAAGLGLGGESMGGGLAAMSSRRPGSGGSRPRPSANRPISPRLVKYVKHEKRTTKEFVDKVKAEQGLLDLDGSILEMEARDLLGHFRRPNKPEEVDKNLFARNIVWHFYREILAGKMPEFVKEGCNIRTIYYIVKPIFTQKGVFADVDDFYGNFAEAFKTLVEIGLISYRDFNIMDDNKAFRFLPDPDFNTNVLLLAEKKAFAGRFSALASKYGVMSQITEGQSKLITADTMLTEMFEAGFDLNKSLSILSFCDFDPVGTSIPYHFVQHFKTLGFHNINEFAQYGDQTMNRLTDTNDSEGRPIYQKVSQRRPCLDIVNPHELDRDIINRIRHRLEPSVQDNPSTADWAFITGGVTGTGRNKEYAISSEQFLPYLEEHLEKKLLPLLGKPAEAVGRRSNFKFLAKALKEYIGTRALRDAEARRAQPSSS
jgi:hypothetical protein